MSKNTDSLIIENIDILKDLVDDLSKNIDGYERYLNRKATAFNLANTIQPSYVDRIETILNRIADYLWRNCSFVKPVKFKVQEHFDEQAVTYKNHLRIISLDDQGNIISIIRREGDRGIDFYKLLVERIDKSYFTTSDLKSCKERLRYFFKRKSFTDKNEALFCEALMNYAIKKGKFVEKSLMLSTAKSYEVKNDLEGFYTLIRDAATHIYSCSTQADNTFIKYQELLIDRYLKKIEALLENKIPLVKKGDIKLSAINIKNRYQISISSKYLIKDIIIKKADYLRYEIFDIINKIYAKFLYGEIKIRAISDRSCMALYDYNKRNQGIRVNAFHLTLVSKCESENIDSFSIFACSYIEYCMLKKKEPILLGEGLEIPVDKIREIRILTRREILKRDKKFKNFLEQPSKNINQSDMVFIDF